jgi:hypothetical protein
MIGPMDEYPIHQAPLPAAWAATSDRNFYDRCYLHANDRTGDIAVISGLGYYPNLGTKDAFVLVRRGDVQTAVHLGDAIDQNRLDQRVGGYRIEVLEPLRKLRVVLEETEGIGLDLTWEGSFDPLYEQPHLLRHGARVTLDAQRFAQLGSWEGTIAVDGEEIAVTPDRWVGTRDRSWGIRPVGEAEPPGRPADPPFEGMWWVYLPVRFEEFALVLILQEEPDGRRTLNDCNRIWKDGRIEQLGWPEVTVHYASGTRIPTGATLDCATRGGRPLRIEVESRLAVPLHLGAGYGGDADWSHGVWKGPDFTERVTYDLKDEAVAGKVMFGMVDHVARVTCEGAEGFGLFEHGALGRHDPSGFADWFTLAP